jgi:hypothetical protein
MVSGTNPGTKTSIRRSFARTPRRRAATCQTVVQLNRAWSTITTRLKWMALGCRYPRRRFRTFQHPMEGPMFVRRRRLVRPKEKSIVSFCRPRRELAAAELAPTEVARAHAISPMLQWTVVRAPAVTVRHGPYLLAGPRRATERRRVLPRFEPFVFYSRSRQRFCRWVTEKPARACLRCTTESITGWDEKRNSGENGGSSKATPDLRLMVLRTAPKGVEPNGPRS